ncbi:phosphoglycerate mutase-like protein [Epithele typhae]|uniref:phosphoglycerate mutase-like protein n=1 Tax=Epithele typhae TaxID=378194 RepID=UPI0020085FB9|nr:phosphoglycerate mutase-like protein [Epithele typhae]KAH9945329.1 phosphoglycerate mutase-like protein [Epithele typhae]
MMKLSLWLVSAALAAVASAAAPEARGSFDYAAHLGNLSPYRSAAVPSGMTTTLPDGCVVDQVMLAARHGSRYPLSSELTSITGLVQALGNATGAVAKARLPADLAFLKAGYTSTLGHDDLTAPGRLQLFQHGVEFALAYPHLRATGVLAGNQDRVLESAQWFAQGYFGRGWGAMNASAFATINEDHATVSWITPTGTCKKWDYNYGNNATIEWGSVYLPRIAKRLNKVVPGVGFTTDNVHGALYACAYDLAAHGVSPWCGAFTPAEIKDFEYELDLLMDGAFGYNLPTPMGAVLGGLYVQKLVERFTNETGTASPMYLEFGHDTTIDLALTALGLFADKPPLSASGPARASRKFRTSSQVPFAAKMVWERFACGAGGAPQIRLLLNDAPVPLAMCAKTDKRLGSCALADFVHANAASVEHGWGDARWNATCGM